MLGVFGSQTGERTALATVGQLRGLLMGCDLAAFTADKGRFGQIDGEQDFSMAALVALPQKKGPLQGVLFTLIASILEGLTDKSSLVWR